MIRRDDELLIGGIPATELAEQYGTPIYVYDAETVRERYNEVMDAFARHYEDFELHYAVKANSNPAVLDLLLDEGACFDCGSPAEIWLADRVGADVTDVLYTGAYNKGEELEYAVEQGVTVNFDSAGLLDKVDTLPERVAFRVNPGIGSGDHGLVFAGADAKFGIPEDEIVDAYRKAQERGVERFGMHMMTGSNVRDPDYFAQITEKLLEIAGRVSDELDIEFEFIDIGGGLGVPYKPDDEPLDIEETAEKVVAAFEQGVAEHDLGEPALWMEPGRYLVAEAGVLLTDVTHVKEAGKTFVGVDTGMHQMLRPMLYDAYHEILVANDLTRKTTGEKTVVGPICESTDVLAKDRPLPEIAEGDVLGIMKAGAYGFTMASNWNTRRLPAEVLVDDGEAREVRSRQSYANMFARTGI